MFFGYPSLALIGPAVPVDLFHRSQFRLTFQQPGDGL